MEKQEPVWPQGLQSAAPPGKPEGHSGGRVSARAGESRFTKHGDRAECTAVHLQVVGN